MTRRTIEFSVKEIKNERKMNELLIMYHFKVKTKWMAKILSVLYKIFMLLNTFNLIFYLKQ